MIVALLPNPWFPKETPVDTVVRCQNDWRVRARELAKTPAGKKLEIAAGDWYTGIYWAYANPQHMDKPTIFLNPDIIHVRKLLAYIRPKIVMCFGKQAILGAEQSGLSFIERCWNPMARGRTQQELTDRVQEIIRKYENAN